MKTSPIEAFTNNLTDVSALDDSSFFELYPWHFNQFSIDLKKEILNNLTKLSDDQFKVYLEDIKYNIKETFAYDPIAPSIIDYWLKKFDLDENDFPFLFDENVTELTNAVYNKNDLKTAKTKLVRKIQLEFYWYASFLEANKMLEFIDILLIEQNRPDKQIIDQNILIKEILDQISNNQQIIVQNSPAVQKIEPKSYFLIKDGKTRHNKAKSLFDKLILNNYINKSCRANFINAFTGTKPKEKVNWIGFKGDLKSFLKYCNSEKLFSDNTNIWVIATEVFTFNEVNFTPKQIKDTKITKNDYSIKVLVKSIF